MMRTFFFHQASALRGTAKVMVVGRPLKRQAQNRLLGKPCNYSCTGESASYVNEHTVTEGCTAGRGASSVVGYASPPATAAPACSASVLGNLTRPIGRCFSDCRQKFWRCKVNKSARVLADLNASQFICCWHYSKSLFIEPLMPGIR